MDGAAVRCSRGDAGPLRVDVDDVDRTMDFCPARRCGFQQRQRGAARIEEDVVVTEQRRLAFDAEAARSVARSR